VNKWITGSYGSLKYGDFSLRENWEYTVDNLGAASCPQVAHRIFPLIPILTPSIIGFSYLFDFKSKKGLAVRRGGPPHQ
jgi:hypothetical protein